jgi:hypothetical protein
VSNIIVRPQSLTLKQLAPAQSASFSPNPYRWMRTKAHFYRDGGVRRKARTRDDASHCFRRVVESRLKPRKKLIYE